MAGDVTARSDMGQSARRGPAQLVHLGARLDVGAGSCSSSAGGVRLDRE